MPSVVDLFCGAGGLATGLERAGLTTVAAVDSNADAIATLGRNQAERIPIRPASSRTYLADTRLVCADVDGLSRLSVVPSGSGKDWRPDLLAGGPPCQPFSSAGKQTGLSDPRGRLFLEFVRLADELRPRVILFENVRGLLTAKTPDGRPGGVLELIQKSFEGIGYACKFAVLNAADYGAPQRRIRLFMLGTCEHDLPDFPPTTHERRRESIPPSERCEWVSLASALASLEEPSDDQIVLPSGKYADQLYELAPGTGLKTRGIVEANRPGGHWGYRQDGFLADLELPARTIRAASTPDWIYDRLGRLRRLTLQECAIIQGFPPRWGFTGTKASQFRQVGNAVQGVIAETLGRACIGALAGRQTERPSSAAWPEYFVERVRYTQMEHRVNGRHRRVARAATARE